MSNNLENSKTDFIRFVMSTIEHNSSDEQKSREYLSSQGLNVDAILSEGMKRVKKLQMKINAEKTRMEMVSAEEVKKKAEEWVNNLMNNIDFSVQKVIEEEALTVSFRNVESLDKEGFKNILINHFTLKFLAAQKESGTTL